MNRVDRPRSVVNSRITTVKTRAERLQDAMTIRGVSQNAVDKMAGLGDGWTNRFLSGAIQKPGAETLQKVCDALHIRVAWLMNGTGLMDADFADGGASSSRIMTPIASAKRHPDVEATVRLWRTRKTWSEAALVLADEIAKARHIEPEKWPEILDSLETSLSRIKAGFLR